MEERSRFHTLKQSWGFECGCKRCQIDGTALNRSSKGSSGGSRVGLEGGLGLEVEAFDAKHLCKVCGIVMVPDKKKKTTTPTKKKNADVRSGDGDRCGDGISLPGNNIEEAAADEERECACNCFNRLQ